MGYIGIIYTSKKRFFETLRDFLQVKLSREINGHFLLNDYEHGNPIFYFIILMRTVSSLLKKTLANIYDQFFFFFWQF